MENATVEKDRSEETVKERERERERERRRKDMEWKGRRDKK